MKPSNITLSFLTSLALLFSACNNRQGATNDIEFSTITIHEKAEEYKDAAKSKENKYIDMSLDISFTFPSQYEGDEVPDALRKSFVTLFLGSLYTALSPETAVKEHVNNFYKHKERLIKEYKKMEETAGEEDEHQSTVFYYHQSIQDTIFFNKEGLISVGIEKSLYTGGAHGSNQIITRTLQVNNGEKLTEGDIFEEEYEDTLTEILLTEIMQQNNVSSKEDLVELGYSNIENILPNGNFYLSDKGITYTFNEYEIACYAIGSTEVFVSHESIGSLIKQDGPASFLTR